MKVSNFMIPADKVITVLPQDTVQTVMGIMMEKRIGTVVVVDKVDDKEMKVEEENLKPTIWLPMPVGIITKSDIMKGYQNQISINAPCSEIMHPCADKELKTCTPNMGSHEVAQILREIKTHHLIVVDQKKPDRVVGILSSFDIATDVCADGGGFPWNLFQTCSNKVAEEEEEPLMEEEPDGTESILHHKHNKNVTYEDFLDVQGIW